LIFKPFPRNIYLFYRTIIIFAEQNLFIFYRRNYIYQYINLITNINQSSSTTSIFSKSAS